MAESTRYISQEELKKHNKHGDLWISVKGKIYDVSKWAKNHPGGEIPLFNLAGQDVTDAFIAYHPGTAWQYLDQFFTGYYLNGHSVSEASRDYRRLVKEFSEIGLFEKKGHGVLFCFCFLALLLTLIVYGVVCSDSTWVHLGCGALLGLFWNQSGFIGHDSGHYQVMTSRRFNRLVQVISGNCLAGLSINWWKRNHNAHHITCNSLDFDPDLQLLPFFAVSSKYFDSIPSFFHDRNLDFDSVARFLVCYQHWTFYPVMCFARINLYVQSLLFLLANPKKVPNKVQELLGIAVFWIWFPLLVFCLPNWGERLMFVVVSFSVTAIQHVQFCLNHFSASVYLGPPSANDWFEKQTKGTLNIACPSWMDWFHGGLQFQIEHHLFPRLPRCNLRKVSPFVKELCKNHNLPYTSVSFWKANEMTLGTLRAAALQARDLANPVPKNLVWEAVHTHG